MGTTTSTSRAACQLNATTSEQCLCTSQAAARVAMCAMNGSYLTLSHPSLCGLPQPLPPPPPVQATAPMINLPPTTVAEGVDAAVAAAKIAISSFDGNGDEQAVLGNHIIETVAQHLSAFTDGELYLLPNGFLRGGSKLYVQSARDKMVMLRKMADAGVASMSMLLVTSGILLPPSKCIGTYKGTGTVAGKPCNGIHKMGCVVCKDHKSAANDWVSEQASKYAA